MNSQIIDTASGILRLEFLTENQRTQFFTHVKQNRLDGGFQQKKCKVKVEPDSNAGDRLAKQPFYTLLEIFRNLLPEEEKGPRGQLQSDINTLDAPSSSLLAQVSYILHLRFPRRYVCVIFVTSRYLEDIQSNWQATFDSNMDKANQLIQALSRAAIDRTTTYRFSYDKAKFPSSTSPYPILFRHVAVPCQPPFSASSASTTRCTWPIKNYSAALSSLPDDTGSFGKNSKSKGRGTAPSKGTQSNKGKQSQGKPKGSYSDRSPDQTFYGRRYDDNSDSGPPGSTYRTGKGRPRPTTFYSQDSNNYQSSNQSQNQSQLQCVPPAVVSLQPINSALLVIKPHYQTPPTLRSPCQSLTIGDQVSPKMEINALNSLDKGNAHYANSISSSSRMRRTSINKSCHPPLKDNDPPV